MCFTQQMSAILSVSGFVVGIWAYSQTKNLRMLAGIWYFVAMEVLQFFQFYWLNQCDNPINQWLTVIGFLHISFQPYFTHTFSSAFMKNERKRAQMDMVRKLSLIMGAWMFSRYLLYTPEHALGSCTNTEWLRGNKACTFMGNYHIAWEMPLHAPTYFMPSNGIHCFMMFAPYFAMGMDMWLNGAILLVTGPVLSKYITDNLYEQASIWCFFSIGQVILAVVLLRIQLKSSKRDLWTYRPDAASVKHANGNGVHANGNGTKAGKAH